MYERVMGMRIGVRKARSLLVPWGDWMAMGDAWRNSELVKKRQKEASAHKERVCPL